MRVVLLGTAAGGGFPRWNCACPRCAAARDGKLPARAPECAAVTGNSRDWWLLNASPELRAQLTAASALWPGLGPGPGDGPVRGVLLTDAEADHVAGLAVLRQAAGLKTYAAPPVLTVLGPARAALDRHTPWAWADSLAEGGFVLAGGLVVTAHPVAGRAPAYVRDRVPDDRWVTAYRIEDLATGGVLVYAPRVSGWSPMLDDLVAAADCVVLDGTHFTADEAARPGRHLPVSGPDGSLAAVTRHPHARRIYTHLADTNPLLDPASEARAQVSEAGAEVLPDGTEFVL
ncbi:MBL fold metallo-hydrolase [Streptomyces sp. ISL-22]|uniref:pyrroloquinoline quinone biosynthesis protein PqqB n=1 Tax=unclassified Streptomyces TaxID=2593676 RepID=UPI001BEAC3FD|nr:MULTISPECIES: MBL fold metallo-hydrolase [unclassified Streptomyces]MBT2420260.1 MBL fold metallo-hydrolase [Streptomyces sp. ISL-24]MBT2433126.1 MBL fold metallo-hydrolase [Streptomyces sp. ISL-22]